MGYDAYLNRRQSKELATGGSVKVEIDGEYKWISGRDARSLICD